MLPPTPGTTLASRGNHRINSSASVSAFQTLSGEAAISVSSVIERVSVSARIMLHLLQRWMFEWMVLTGLCRHTLGDKRDAQNAIVERIRDQEIAVGIEVDRARPA